MARISTKYGYKQKGSKIRDLKIKPEKKKEVKLINQVME